MKIDQQEEYLNEIDDYVQTIHAIVGFMNFYLYDEGTKANRKGVLLFQGARLEPSSAKSINSDGNEVHFVTPDLGIFVEPDQGVVGEVKKSFPKEQDLWMRTFKQLMSYDDDLQGWPCEGGRVRSHDIVLILHQSRAMAVLEFFKNRSEFGISFKRPFVMIQFNRSDERQPYYFFQKVHGTLSETPLNEKLLYGQQVPMWVFVGIYSMVKIYDSRPPVPYLLELIWTHVVTVVASDNPGFKILHKNQKLDVTLEVDVIVDQLCDGFSFRRLCTDKLRQTRNPRREWVVEACERLVVLNEAAWVDSTKKQIKIFFKKYDDVRTHFVKACVDDGHAPGQLLLFENQ